MNTLPDDIFDRIMRFNSHPCADMINDEFIMYNLVLDLHSTSRDPTFRQQDAPSFLEWKVHGLGCPTWAPIFEQRKQMVIGTDTMTLLAEHMNGTRYMLELWRIWRYERVQLQRLEYHLEDI